MKAETVISCKNIQKKYGHFELNIDSIDFPQGFATALIGENGAGKTTLLEMIAGIKKQHKGDITYFGSYTEKDRENNPYVKENIGYTGTDKFYFLPHWTLKQTKELQSVLFDSFDGKKYDKILDELAVTSGSNSDNNKKVSSLSDGNRVKLMLAGVLARDTKLLLMDEPASPLDPLMRERLCSMIRDYLASSEGSEKSVIFSTHNISDMENVTDYAIIIENGTVVEQGFVEDLKEKYIYVRGEKKDEESAKHILFDITSNKYGYEGLCLSENLKKLAGMDIETSAPTLSQLSVGIMRAHTRVKPLI
ncbi:MAG: ABC transporter ATP-binding protein [Butyrivibrio hungatei]|nr:ABC transporter ATP-binding protein [Butyrivibrio hungatei]